MRSKTTYDAASRHDADALKMDDLYLLQSHKPKMHMCAAYKSNT